MKAIKELCNCLIISCILGGFGLFILNKWVSQNQEQTKQIVLLHKQGLGK